MDLCFKLQAKIYYNIKLEINLLFFSPFVPSEHFSTSDVLFWAERIKLTLFLDYFFYKNFVSSRTGYMLPLWIELLTCELSLNMISQKKKWKDWRIVMKVQKE